MTRIKCDAYWCKFANAGECDRDEIHLAEQQLKSDKRFMPACVSMKPIGIKAGDDESEARMMNEADTPEEDE